MFLNHHLTVSEVLLKCSKRSLSGCCVLVKKTAEALIYINFAVFFENKVLKSKTMFGQLTKIDYIW